jgi:hypothetical protein
MYDRPFLRRAPLRLTLVAWVALHAAACAPSLGGAVGAYEHGRYPDAIDELCAVERDAQHWNGSDGARYALYRGLAHVALGDLAAGRRWFGRLEQMMAADPEVLSAHDAERLASAQAHLPR